MVSKVSIFCHTQKSYADALFAILGRGKRHAGIFYSAWMRKEEARVEAQAAALMEEISAHTDVGLPELVLKKEEGKIVKYLLKFDDGRESESVILPMAAGATLCISSQVGCKMGCSFCETGKMGLLRSLSAREIVSQVYYARAEFGVAVRNIVFMGMGEPLDNFEEVQQAIKVLMDPHGLGFGPSRITVSTSGHVENMYRFMEKMDPAVNLAVSVNAPNDAVRNRIMPVNRRWNMGELKTAMEAYCAHPRREILVEYVLLKGINDSLESADELAEYLRGLKVKVNLIPYNAQSRDRYDPPEEEVKEAFLARMREKGYQTLLRHNKGRSIMAACGQLGNKKQNSRLPIV